MTVMQHAVFFREVAMYTLREDGEPRRRHHRSNRPMGQNSLGHLERNSLAHTQEFGPVESEVGCHHILHGDAHGLVDRDLLI